MKSLRGTHTEVFRGLTRATFAALVAFCGAILLLAIGSASPAAAQTTPSAPSPPTNCAVQKSGSNVTVAWAEVANASSYSVRNNGRVVAEEDRFTSYTRSIAGQGIQHFSVATRTSAGLSFYRYCGKVDPSRTAPAAPAWCSGQLTDGNKLSVTTPRVDGAGVYQVVVNGQPSLSVTAGLESTVVLDNITLNPGVNHFSVRAGEEIIGSNNVYGPRRYCGSVTVEDLAPLQRCSVSLVNGNVKVTIAGSADAFRVYRNGVRFYDNVQVANTNEMIDRSARAGRTYHYSAIVLTQPDLAPRPDTEVGSRVYCGSKVGQNSAQVAQPGVCAFHSDRVLVFDSTVVHFSTVDDPGIDSYELVVGGYVVSTTTAGSPGQMDTFGVQDGSDRAYQVRAVKNGQRSALTTCQ